MGSDGPYRAFVATNRESAGSWPARQAMFSAWIQAVRRLAQQRHGTSSWGEIADRSGISRATLYRWAGEQLKEPPDYDQVAMLARWVGGVDAAGAPTRLALDLIDQAGQALWPRATDAVEVGGHELPPTVLTLLRALQDPSVSESEKTHIFATLSDLASRPGLRSGRAVG